MAHLHRKTFLPLLLSLAALPQAFAQGDPSAPPKVLVIQREYLKPGKGGTLHEKSESNFVKASIAAKLPTHYIAMDSLTGPYRSLFFLGYDSFDAWQKDSDAQDKNLTLSAAFDHASQVDGDLLASSDQSAWVFRPDLSHGSSVDIATMRYFEITQFKIKPGRGKEWEELARLYKENFAKAVPDVNWAAYENQYGAEGGVFLILIPLKSLSQVDRGFTDDKQFMAALGESGRKRFAELTAYAVDITQTNLFHFNPRMSYAPDHFAAVDAAFWKPKPTPKHSSNPSKAQ